MHEITFGKESYHLNSTMEQWCRDNIGQGRWVSGRLTTWEDIEPNLWVIESMFGNTTFMFKEDNDYFWFVLRWS